MALEDQRCIRSAEPEGVRQNAFDLDVIEPFLVQQGYLLRTPRGRVAGAPAWRQLGLEPPPTPRGASLFDQND